MADPSQYFVHPDTGEVGTVSADESALALERGFKPATEQQIKQYDARVEAAASPIASTLKSAALGAAELVAPTSIARTIMDVGAQPEALVSGLAERFPRDSVRRRLLLSCAVPRLSRQV
jgi:hypothetical protein